MARMLAMLMPSEPETAGLLALLLLTEARGESRVGADGELVLLADQDRDRWDQRLIGEGIVRATAALERGEGRFTLQAAIAGLHAVAPSWNLTDWRQVARMYDALMARWPSPVVALNRVAARSLDPEADLEAALDDLDLLAFEPVLERYSYLPATRADVLARLGRQTEAATAYDEALALSTNETEQRFLLRRKAALGRESSPGIGSSA
jgi:RNA polymerase sigma-70 factor (ECF subfamily)